MKKFLLLLFCIGVGISVFAQQRGFTELGFYKLKEIAMSDKSASDSYFMGGKGGIPSILAMDAFINYVDTLKDKTSPLVLNKNNIKEVYNSIENNARSYKVSFIGYSKGVPSILPFKDSKALLFHSLIYGSTFNTLQLNERDRATRIATEIIIPAIKQIAQKTPATIKYIGCSACYGSKDFSEKTETAKSDFLLIIVPVSLVKEYISCYITEDDFLEKSDIYLSTRDYFSDIKKIKLSIK